MKTVRGAYRLAGVRIGTGELVSEWRQSPLDEGPCQGRQSCPQQRVIGEVLVDSRKGQALMSVSVGDSPHGALGQPPHYRRCAQSPILNRPQPLNIPDLDPLI